MRTVGLIGTLAALREEESRLRACVSKADRSLDLSAAKEEARRRERQCDALRRKLDRLRLPPRDGEARRKVEAGHDAGQVLLPGKGVAPPPQGVARIAPRGRWVAASRVKRLSDVRRVLAAVEEEEERRRGQGGRRHDWAVRAWPHAAVPDWISTSDDVQVLQNLPAWQSARLTLLACAAKEAGWPTLRRWARVLGVWEAYWPALRTLCQR